MSVVSDTRFNLVSRLLFLISGFFDNWFYLGRIGLYKFRSDNESKWISRFGTTATIIAYAMEVVREFTEAKRKSNGDRQKERQILYQRRWFLILKLLEFPVSL